MALNTVMQAASRILKNSKVAARIEELRRPVAKKAQLTLEAHLDDLQKLRNMAVRDQKWGAAIQAEIARGRAAGLYVEKTEVTGAGGAPIATTNMTIDEFRQAAREVLDII